MAISLIISRLLYARDLHENKSLAKRRNEALDNRIGECFNNNSKGVEPIFQLSPPCGGTFFARVSPAKPFQLSPPVRGMTQKAEDSTYSAMISTLTPCGGRDLHPMKNIGIPQPFQLSRPVRGVTVSLNSDGRGLEISTLTPCEGRDRDPAGSAACPEVHHFNSHAL